VATVTCRGRLAGLESVEISATTDLGGAYGFALIRVLSSEAVEEHTGGGAIRPGATHFSCEMGGEAYAENYPAVETVAMTKVDLSSVLVRIGSSYPAPVDEPCRERRRAALGDAAGLSQFGVNLLTLPPGVWSSQRHWHSAEDEFVWVLEGEVVLVTDAGEEVLRAGDCAGFKAGVANGHHLQNRSQHTAHVLEVGSRCPDQDVTDYPDVDLRWGSAGLTRKDGSRY
jgi:uncharacterized cupin superfamily protein